MEKQTLAQRDIPLGEAINWDIFDREGRLLLKKGMRLRSAQQISRLLKHGAFRWKDAEVENTPVEEAAAEINDVLSPFDNIEQVSRTLAQLIHRIIHTVADPNARIEEKTREATEQLISLCEYDLDATLGAIHLGHEFSYTITHPINTAILCFIVAGQLELDPRRRLSLMAAALTANIGMFSLQNTLLDQEGPLTPEQRKQIEKHPLRSAVLLKHWGVRDRLWLEIVLQHHEQKDGSGYPRKLKDEAFIREARILGLADRYHALLSPRKHRRGLSPTEALSKLFRDRGKEVDEEITLAFIRELGIYPPGTTVRLKNGDTSIVTRRGEDRMKPLVKSVVNDRGIFYPEPVSRDSAKGLTEITGMCRPIANYEPDFKDLWDYKLD